jgi:hypothetical protein
MSTISRKIPDKALLLPEVWTVAENVKFRHVHVPQPGLNGNTSLLRVLGAISPLSQVSLNPKSQVMWQNGLSRWKVHELSESKELKPE